MMLDKVKLALRKTAAVFDDEIEDYITSGIADLRLFVFPMSIIKFKSFGSLAGEKVK